MSQALHDPYSECWLAVYIGADGYWRIAKDARGHDIRCENKELAESVAAMRRRRCLPL